MGLSRKELLQAMAAAALHAVVPGCDSYSPPPGSGNGNSSGDGYDYGSPGGDTQPGVAGCPSGASAVQISNNHRHLLAVPEAEIEARPNTDTDGKYGHTMWKLVGDRCQSLQLPEFPHAPPDTLIGGVSDLVSKCKVWLSGRFDVEAVQQAARNQSKAAAS